LKPKETKIPQIFKQQFFSRKQEVVEFGMYFQYILYMYYTCIIHNFKSTTEFYKIKTLICQKFRKKEIVVEIHFAK
jgi:hypothetical protein